MDLQVRKKALRMIPYGIYVLTAKSNEEVAGSTITWLSQASMMPPLVMVGLENQSHSYKAVEKSGSFVVNFLGKDQKEIAKKFFKHPHVDGNAINGLSFRTGSTGAPILLDTPAFIECKVRDIIRHGDHHVVIAEVLDAGINHDSEPLTLRETGWSYGG